MAKKAFVRAKLESLAPQRQQYRPYLFNLQPTEVYIEIEIDPTTVIETMQDGGMVLNVEGFKALLSKLADAVDQVHEAYIQKFGRTGRF